MSEDADLQAKIAALAGRINQHRQPVQPVHHITKPSHYQRWSPYNRGGIHKNRSLVLNGKHAANVDTPSVTAESHPIDAAFVKTQANGTKQLMTRNTYDREQKQKQEFQSQRPAAKKQKTALSAVPRDTRSTNQQKHELEFDGVRFRLLDDGSKLVRLSGEYEGKSVHTLQDLTFADRTTEKIPTPKSVKIADVEFFRTKRGNLIRASALQRDDRYFHDDLHKQRSSLILTYSRSKIRQKPQCEHFTKHGSYISTPLTWNTHDRQTISQDDHSSSVASLSHTLTLLTGTCPFGPACKFSHDPNKVAICKDFLRTGSCPAGKACDLSHEPNYSRVSACSHFLRGNCTNTACRYPHVHVSPTAPVCRPFATLGFCARGADCDKRHALECPDYANHGRCAGREEGKCALPHVDRASTLRKAGRRGAKTGGEDESDVSSSDDGEAGGDGGDDDGGDESELDVMIELGEDRDAQALAQQRDFISF